MSKLHLKVMKTHGIFMFVLIKDISETKSRLLSIMVLRSITTNRKLLCFMHSTMIFSGLSVPPPGDSGLMIFTLRGLWI